MRESGECYVFDDDRIWHMLTPIINSKRNRQDFARYCNFGCFARLPSGYMVTSLGASMFERM
jgi:hypothetical protein